MNRLHVIRRQHVDLVGDLPSRKETGRMILPRQLDLLLRVVATDRHVKWSTPHHPWSTTPVRVNI